MFATSVLRLAAIRRFATLQISLPSRCKVESPGIPSHEPNSNLVSRTQVRLERAVPLLLLTRGQFRLPAPAAPSTLLLPPREVEKIGVGQRAQIHLPANDSIQTVLRIVLPSAPV